MDSFFQHMVLEQLNIHKLKKKKKVYLNTMPSTNIISHFTFTDLNVKV